MSLEANADVIIRRLATSARRRVDRIAGAARRRVDRIAGAARQRVDRMVGAVLVQLPAEQLPGRLGRIRERGLARSASAGLRTARFLHHTAHALRTEIAMADALIRAGRPVEAQAVLSDATARWPRSGRPHLSMATALSRAGETEAARAALSTALALDLTGGRPRRVLNLAVQLRDAAAVATLQVLLPRFGSAAVVELAGEVADAAEVARVMTAGMTPDAVARELGDDQTKLLLATKWAVAEGNHEVLARLNGTLDPTTLDAGAAASLGYVLRRAGELTLSTRLGERVLAERPDDERARTLVDVGRGSLAALRVGRTPLTAARSAYAESVSAPRERTLAYLLHNSLPHASAGYATRTHGLLSALVRDGWEVHGITRPGYPVDLSDGSADDLPALDVIDGVNYHRLLDGPAADYPKWPMDRYVDSYVERVTEIAARHRIGLIHAATNYWSGFAAVEAARRLGLPAVYEVRGMWELTKLSRMPIFGGSEIFRMMAQLEAAACTRADHVLAITDAVRSVLVERGVPSEQITVLSNGVDSARFVPRPRDEQLAAELGLAGTVVIGYVGSILDYEGIDTLLAAAAALRGRRDDFRVLIVGGGKAFDDSVALRDKLGLQDLVIFTGRVPHADVERYYSLIDIAPFPRKPLPVCEVVSPLKPFEAMAMGKVPVVSSVAALTEIVTDGVNGLVFDKHDPLSLTAALDRLVGDPELRARIGQSAREWVIRERDWSVLVGRLQQVYADVTDRSAARTTRVS